MVQFHYYPLLDSTNRLARELIKQGAPAGTVIQAGQQSAGQGQYGKAFFSPSGGLYFSLLLSPPVRLEEASLVTLAAGLGCRDALEQQCGVSLQIKWPNDLYLGSKKVAGILSEYCSQGGRHDLIIVGAGLNINSRIADFPEGLQDILTTVRDSCGTMHDLSKILRGCVEGIKRRVEQLAGERQHFLEEWQTVDYLYGRALTHEIKDLRLCTGCGMGIDRQGRYLVQQDDGKIYPVLGGQLRTL